MSQSFLPDRRAKDAPTQKTDQYEKDQAERPVGLQDRLVTPVPAAAKDDADNEENPEPNGRAHHFLRWSALPVVGRLSDFGSSFGYSRCEAACVAACVLAASSCAFAASACAFAASA